jgi:transcriptional regulator GlxA family with amidase domain
MTPLPSFQPINIAVVLFDAVEELDFAGPWEVLAVWARMWLGDAVEIFTVADSTKPIRCAKGLRVLPDRNWNRIGPVHALVYPGGRGVMPLLGDDRVRRRLRKLAASGTLMTSVCTGALAYADAGLLDGHSATTHWSALDDLAALGRDIAVRRDVRFVDAGGVITAAGVSAGIDMALHLVARLHSRARPRSAAADPIRPAAARVTALDDLARSVALAFRVR